MKILEQLKRHLENSKDCTIHYSCADMDLERDIPTYNVSLIGPYIRILSEYEDDDSSDSVALFMTAEGARIKYITRPEDYMYNFKFPNRGGELYIFINRGQS